MTMQWTERLTWTKKPPTEEGYYWVMDLSGDPPTIVEWCRDIYDHLLYQPGWGKEDGDTRQPEDWGEDDYWWCGPLVYPPLTADDLHQEQLRHKEMHGDPLP